jgi:hypothetical protein
VLTAVRLDGGEIGLLQTSDWLNADNAFQAGSAA